MLIKPYYIYIYIYNYKTLLYIYIYTYMIIKPYYCIASINSHTFSSDHMRESQKPKLNIPNRLTPVSG